MPLPAPGLSGSAVPCSSNPTIPSNWPASTGGWAIAQPTALDVKPEDSARQREIEKAFAAADVVIAEVGAWVNMLDPDAAKARENQRVVASRLAVADAVGARCCVDIAGSYNPKVWYGPEARNLSREFFDATVENCRRILDEVRPKRTRFTIEMMGWALPDGPDSYLELIRAIDRPSFGVHIDVCNVINSPSRFYYNRRVIAECFEKLGRWIVSCHAKDLAWPAEMNVHFVEVVPGRGEIDYSEYLRRVAALPVDAPLMLEHLSTAGGVRRRKAVHTARGPQARPRIRLGAPWKDEHF